MGCSSVYQMTPCNLPCGIWSCLTGPLWWQLSSLPLCVFLTPSPCLGFIFSSCFKAVSYLLWLARVSWCGRSWSSLTDGRERVKQVIYLLLVLWLNCDRQILANHSVGSSPHHQSKLASRMVMAFKGKKLTTTRHDKPYTQ